MRNILYNIYHTFLVNIVLLRTESSIFPSLFVLDALLGLIIDERTAFTITSSLSDSFSIGFMFIT